MRKPKSKFVLAKIKSRPFTIDRRDYVEVLLDIEHDILHGWSGLYAGWPPELRRRKFPEEYAAIYTELDPKGFKRANRQRRGERTEERREKARERAAERRQLSRDRAAWRKLGGIVRPRRSSPRAG